MKTRPEPAPSESLRILTVSDYPDTALTDKIAARTLGPVDLVLSCGDLPPEYLTLLRNRLDCPLLYVMGNHDIRFSRTSPVGCEYIHRRIVTRERITIMGFSGSLWYNGGVNQYSEAMMARFIRGLWFARWRARRIHIIMTHAPPRHIHDKEDLCHRGFECFARLIHTVGPCYFIHGHIHEAFESPEDRITLTGHTRVMNTCGHALIEICP